MEYKEEKTKQIDVVAIAKTMWQHKKAYIFVYFSYCYNELLLQRVIDNIL